MAQSIKHALKIKIKFDKETESIIDRQSAKVNWAYNKLLEIANDLKEEYKKTQNLSIRDNLYTSRGLRNLLPQLKDKHPFLKTVHSSPIKNKALDLSRSIGDYQKSRKGKRKGRKTGWPKFRSQKRKWCALFYDEPNKGFKVDGRKLSISLGSTEDGKKLKAVGSLETSLDKLCKGKILNFKLKKEAFCYYAIFTVEREIPKKKKINKIIAFDPNHKNLSYGVDDQGEAIEIKNPWFLKSLEKNIDQLKARRDRCKRKSQFKKTSYGKSYWQPSRRWKKFQDKLDRLYQKRRDQTKTYLYTLANALFKNYDLVAIGDYTPRGGGINRGMRRSMNNFSLIGRFKEILSWVAIRSGKHFLVWNERGSTKTCSSCEHKLEDSLNPSVREWQCPNCFKNHIRDENAALNGLKETFKLCGSHHREAETLEVTSRRAWKFNGLGIDQIPGTFGSANF